MPGAESSFGKLFATELNLRVAMFADEMLGPFADVEGGIVGAVEGGRWMHRTIAARGLTIAAGSSEIQHNIIGERVLKLPEGLAGHGLSALPHPLGMTEKRLPAFATENDIGWRWISGRPAYAFVAVVTLVAAILRLLYLGKESLWGDEAFTVALASIPLPTMLKLLATDEPNIALYVLMLRGWLALGDSESTIRLLSVVFAAATVPLLYCVARRLAGQPVALLTIPCSSPSTRGQFGMHKRRAATPCG